jgi:hypothetical protein
MSITLAMYHGIGVSDFLVVTDIEIGDKTFGQVLAIILSSTFAIGKQVFQIKLTCGDELSLWEKSRGSLLCQDTRRLITAWSLCSLRLGLIFDVRYIIAKLLWQTRHNVSFLEYFDTLTCNKYIERSSRVIVVLYN